MPPSAMSSFAPATRAWFTETFSEATEVQARGWPHITSGDHVLLLAPTGSGKTLAAFLAAIDRVARQDPDGPPGVRIVYVSPLKALVHDIQHNLTSPLEGIREVANRMGTPLRPIGVDMRTGDTPPKDRERQKRNPNDILVTTPESLFLMLGSSARETLRTVDTVIVDEIHSLAPTKRGAHLALSLERLAVLCSRDPQRIGLSATARPIDTVARFLGGDRPVEIVDASRPPRLDLKVVVPVRDLTAIPMTSRSSNGERVERDAGLMPKIWTELEQLVRANRSTIIFVNARGHCERLAAEINELAGEELVLAHHGSLSHEKRRHIEQELKEGRVRGIVATSSLELGIDMGSVDTVALVESPGSVARGLQRVGRAGHSVGATSMGVVYPKYPADLLECAIIARRMLDGEIESLDVPQNALDVLAQQIVAIVATENTRVDALERLVKRTSPYRDLPEALLRSVLDMLSGRYPSDDFAELRPRISWDRQAGELHARRGTAMLSRLNAGTIPDRGLFAVHHGHGGPRIGELDEEMTFESRPGDVILLGASSWRILEIDRDRVIVEAAPGEPGRLPFWRGDGPGRPIELGRAIGAFLRGTDGVSRDDLRRRLAEETPLDEFAAVNLASYVGAQREATGTTPSDERITIESFRDEAADTRVCILTPFGSRVHAPWALAIQTILSADRGHAIPMLWSDDGIALTIPEGDAVPDYRRLLPSPDDVEELVVEGLASSALFGTLFRENAARSLLLPRRNPAARTPLWAQRLRAKNLLGTVRGFRDFPIVLETYRQCLRDVFDLPALREILEALQNGTIIADILETQKPSPFARSLVFAWVATYLYDQDTPLAERRASALHLDRELLSELLGETDYRDLLSDEVIDRVEAELQGLAEGARSRDLDELHDLLRRVGALDLPAIARRCEPAGTWISDALARLEQELRTIRIRRRDDPDATETWIAAQDAGLYMSAVGAKIDETTAMRLPPEYLVDVPNAHRKLVRRYYKTHGPAHPDRVTAELGLDARSTLDAVIALEADGELVRGAFGSHAGEEYCDRDVLARIKRTALAKLRSEVAAVDGPTYARFVMSWHGIGEAPSRTSAFDVIRKLEGLALPWSSLVTDILPARIEGFRTAMLDDLCARGEILWVGCGSIGPTDGRVRLFTLDGARLLLTPSDRDVEERTDAQHTTASVLQRAILRTLERRGASFVHAIESAVRAENPTLDPRDFEAAIWELVWAGRIHNDTFAPFQSLGKKRGRNAVLAGGRWSLVSDVFDSSVRATEQRHELAKSLLARHGILSRNAMALESVDGGFGAIYEVLRAMEDSGHVRRGHFVADFVGAQFASVAAIEHLRSSRQQALADARVLAATDPANPWGASLPWPKTAVDHAKLRRVPGARVVLTNGEPVFYVVPNRRSILSFETTGDTAALHAAIGALVELRSPIRPRSIDRIDGEDAASHSLAAAFLEHGYVRDYRGLLFEGID
ncbi:MAG: DEAD/DEAH box helicase [Planctomycetes bacterium]|nr:DEAD/DEAH box helicase [Planctomycetota bacterium]